MENQENAIEIRNVSKAFKIFKDRPLTLKEKILKLRSDSYTMFYALKDVSASIKRGESIGLIGHNGCGKSTLLSIIAGILYPTSGNVSVNGRLSCLIELGAGFHPDFTGRENIYTNASIFGLSKKETEKNIESIIEFSELGGFIDNPVRTYSSGMYLKLAFSVAIHINPEILLIDEILAVGDSNFRKKCFNKMQEFRRKGVTIVLVSHSLGSVVEFCDRCLWLHDGVIRMDGNPQEVTQGYLAFMKEHEKKGRDNEESYTHEGSVKSIVVTGEDGAELKNREIPPGSGINVTTEIEKNGADGEITLVVSLMSADDDQIASVRSEPISLKKGERAKMRLAIRSIPLNTGDYSVKAILRNPKEKECCPAAEYPIKFKSPVLIPGTVVLESKWTRLAAREGSAGE